MYLASSTFLMSMRGLMGRPTRFFSVTGTTPARCLIAYFLSSNMSISWALGVAVWVHVF